MQQKHPRIMFNISFLLFNHVLKQRIEIHSWRLVNGWSRFNTPSSWCYFCCWMSAHCASLSFLARSWKQKLNHQPVQPAIWGKRLYSCWHNHMTIMLFSGFCLKRVAVGRRRRWKFCSYTIIIKQFSRQSSYKRWCWWTKENTLNPINLNWIT